MIHNAGKRPSKWKGHLLLYGSGREKEPKDISVSVRIT